MFLAWLSDTFAYLTGRAFGKTKLYEKLSPKKTVEGSLGGLVGAILGSVGSTFWLPIPMFDAIVLAIVANVVGQAGDLFESLLKRSVGVKDSGTLLPGHGGMLDRVDALMYTAAITWLYASQILPYR
jgi:phosphatidate cytidylyltransferase